MYLQLLEDNNSSHRNWPKACTSDAYVLNNYLTLVDDTLNSWAEAHELFNRVQGDKPHPVAAAHRSFTRLVDKVVRQSGYSRLSNFETEVIAHALLKVWIAARQGENHE